MQYRWPLLALALLSCSPLLAQNDPVQQGQAPPVVAVINMAEVIKKYQKAQNMINELERVEQEWWDKIKPIRDQLNSCRPPHHNRCLSPPERENKEREIARLQKELQAVEEDAKNDLAKRKGLIYPALYHEVEDAVSRLASSRGYAVVFFYNDANDADEKYSETNVRRKFELPAAVMPIYIANQVDISASIVQALEHTALPDRSTGSGIPSGKWVIYQSVIDGEKRCGEVPITLGEFMLEDWEGSHGQPRRIQWDPTTNPPRLDIQSGNDGQATVPGIYHLHGDDLVLCWVERVGEERPTDFSSEPRSHRVVLYLRRRP